MNCSACGNTLMSDAHFCPRCGAVQTPAPFLPAAPYAGPYNRVARHIQVLSLLWLAYAVYRALTGLAGLLFLHSFFGTHFGHDWNSGWSPFNHMGLGVALWPVALVSLLMGVAFALVTGHALLTRQPWARIVAIIFGVLALFHPLLGTILGIYTLWVLAPGLSGAEYDSLTAQRTA